MNSKESVKELYKERFRDIRNLKKNIDIPIAKINYLSPYII